MADEPIALDEYREVPDDEETDLEAEAEAKEEAPAKPEWAETRTITVFDRDFVIGQLGKGAQQAPTPSSRAALFGMLAALSVEDVIMLGSAALQFDDDREGRGFLRKAPDGQQIPLSPIVRALFLNVMQSEDLRDSLADFFDGLRMTESLFGSLGIDLS